MDEDTLIARVAAGDDVALRELFTRHAPMLAARLRVLLPASDVEDVLQETFLAAWRGAARYQPTGPYAAWLWGIARRQAALLLRRRGPAAATLPDLATATDTMQDALSRVDLERAVATLAPAEREVWRLVYLEDRPVAEAARLAGVPPGTVKSRAHRARRLLREALHSKAEGGMR
jgi:RNA polymerase sigma-70 factor (ECF subfamily)